MKVNIVPFSRNVQVSRLLPELCGRHVVLHGPSGYARLYLQNRRTSTDNRHGAFDSKNLHPQPFSRFQSLLDFARIFLPMKHTFSHSKIGRNKLHSFSKISASFFSLLEIEMCLHSQLLDQISRSPSHGQFIGVLHSQLSECFLPLLPHALIGQE